MATPALCNKWKMWFKILDVTHDGVLSNKDVEASRTKFAELHHLDTDKRKVVFEEFKKWWEEFVMRGNTKDIKETDFVEMLKMDYKTGKDQFKNKIEKCVKVIFNVLSTDKEAMMSKEDYNMAYKAYGHEKIAQDPTCFEAYKPVGGKVPLKKLINEWVEFLTNEGESKESIIRKEFEAHGYM